MDDQSNRANLIGETVYTQEKADHICAELAKGLSLREVCRQDGMPHESTVRLWALDDREGFATQYARAREIGYQLLADELLEIADDRKRDPQDRRVSLDTRKWLLSKTLPKIYGDKTEHKHTGADGGNIVIEVVNFSEDEDTE